MEADKFESQGAKMGTSQAVLVKSSSQKLRSRAVENNIHYWSKAKSDVEHYATVISRFNQSINIRVQGGQQATKPVCFKEIGLTLSLPASISTK